MKIFAPYWRTVAVTVVQDLQRRPQIAQQVSELFAMGVQDFLVLTQVHTIPYFVLRKKQDILQRIADACGQSAMALCREHSNMAAILSSILLQSSSDVESLMINLLTSVSPDFNNVDCAELLRSEPQATAAELLKIAGEHDETKGQIVCFFTFYIINARHLFTAIPGTSSIALSCGSYSWQAPFKSWNPEIRRNWSILRKSYSRDNGSARGYHQ